MPSMRRMQSTERRSGAAHVEDEDIEDFPDLKLSNSKSYMVAGRFLVSLLNSVCDWIKGSVGGVFYLPHYRLRDSLGSNELNWDRAYIRIFVFFLAGAFIGLTLSPFLWVDVPNSFDNENQEIPMKGNAGSGVVPEKIYRELLEEASVGGKVDLSKNSSIVKSESLDLELAQQRLLIIVTPTYVRPFQAYHLSRLAHTLRNVPSPLLWIVVELAKQSDETAKILRGSGVMFRHLICDRNVTNVKDRGLFQRNVALSHIESHRLDGIVHFADDAVIYSLDIFLQMRKISRFGTWPVAIVSASTKKMMIEGPVCNGSHVTGWHSDQNEISRRVRVEMAGFAFNSTILWEATRWYQDTVDPVEDGLEEIAYIEQVLEDESGMECVTENRSSVMAWHLNLEAPELVYPNGWTVKKNLEVVALLT